MDEDQFKILLVCTANQCRSPIAEVLLRHELDQLGLARTWSVGSAGSNARDGDDMHPLARQVLASRGLEVRDWRSRKLTPDVIRHSDLVLAATSVHRRSVVVMEPRSIRKTHLLRQFAALCDLVEQRHPTGAAAGRDLLTAALAARSRASVRPPGTDDLKDPIGKPYDAFEACAVTISENVSRILRPLRR